MDHMKLAAKAYKHEHFSIEDLQSIEQSGGILTRQLSSEVLALRAEVELDTGDIRLYLSISVVYQQ